MRFEGAFINEKGKRVDWRFEASSEEALRKHLQEKGWKIVSMKEQPISPTNVFYGAKKIVGIALAIIAFPIALCLFILDRIGHAEREKIEDRKRAAKEAEQILKEASGKARPS